MSTIKELRSIKVDHITKVVGVIGVRHLCFLNGLIFGF